MTNTRVSAFGQERSFLNIYGQIKTLLFIFHSRVLTLTPNIGMAFLGVFGFAWAGTLLGTGIGPVLILAGLLFMSIATFFGYKQMPNK